MKSAEFRFEKSDSDDEGIFEKTPNFRFDINGTKSKDFWQKGARERFHNLFFKLFFIFVTWKFEETFELKWRIFLNFDISAEKLG